MGRLLRASMMSALILYALLPLVVLLIAACLPPSSVRLTGISANGLSQFHGLSTAPLLAAENVAVWRSLERSVLLAMTVASCASTLAVVTAFILTRRRSLAGRFGIRALALAAYGVPSVFLLLGTFKTLLAVTASPIVRIYIIHFLYVFPMSLILALGYAASHSTRLDMAAALDGAGWPSRLMLAWRAYLWRGHLAILSIAALVSWGDIVFSQQLLPSESKLLADLYVDRFLVGDSTFVDYRAASLFGLVLTLLAFVLAILVAASNREGE